MIPLGGVAEVGSQAWEAGVKLPFDEAAFLDVFGQYNNSFWPFVVGLWATTVIVCARWMVRGGADRSLLILLAVHWAWSGVAYHELFFRRINPAATLFGLLFVLEAAFFAWLAIAPRARFAFAWSVRGVLAAILAGYALIYPALGFLSGMQYPRLPLFAVPCPTTLLTAGLLLASSGVPRIVRIVPAFWAAIAGSAALLLGVRADLALFAAGALMVVDTLAPRAFGSRDTAFKAPAHRTTP
jgi:hypothetical protein